MAGRPPQGQGYPPTPSDGQQPPRGQQPPQGQPYAPPPQGHSQQGYAPHPGMQQKPYDPNAPFGFDPQGRPYSDKQKLLVGLLQLLPVITGLGGIGRLYSGDTGTGIAQLLLSCIGIGGIWSIIDGIIVLTSDNSVDKDGRPFRPN